MKRSQWDFGRRDRKKWWARLIEKSQFIDLTESYLGLGCRAKARETYFRGFETSWRGKRDICASIEHFRRRRRDMRFSILPFETWIISLLVSKRIEVVRAGGKQRIYSNPLAWRHGTGGWKLQIIDWASANFGYSWWVWCTMRIDNTASNEIAHVSGNLMAIYVNRAKS
jgi:hypothetical protein